MFKKKKDNVAVDNDIKEEEVEEIKENNSDEENKEVTNENIDSKPEENNNHEFDVDLNQKVEYDNNYLVGIEEARAKFHKIFKVENILKWVMGAVVMATIVVSFVWLMPNNQGLALGVCGGALALLIIYYVVIKNYNSKKLNTYFDEYYSNLNSYTFVDNPSYSEISGTVNDRIDTETFNKCNMYKDVVQVGARNLLNFKFNNLNCTIVDCAAQIKTVKRLQPVFVGKLFTAPNKYKGDEVIVYLKGNERSLPPTNVEEKRKVINTKNMVVYSNAEKQPTIINKKLKEILNKIKTNNILVDVAISIQEGMTYVALGYDDNLMVLPLQERFNQIPLVQFKKDLEVICELAEYLNK